MYCDHLFLKQCSSWTFNENSVSEINYVTQQEINKVSVLMHISLVGPSGIQENM